MNKILVVSLLFAFPLIMNDRDSTGRFEIAVNNYADITLPLMYYQAADTRDYGDAPAAYGSADHIIDGKNYLGSPPDGEPGNQPSPEADMDDLKGTDDEDGVTFPELFQGARVTVSIKVTGLAYLNAWVDWNGDGDFSDSGERIVTNSLRFTGTANISVNVPANAIISRSTFARFRFGPKSTSKPAYDISGSANYGEVEDYQIKILCVPPDPPKVGDITQPTCDVSTGSVILEGLPSTGTWTLTRWPDGVSTTGTGTTVKLSGIAPGTYTFTVTNDRNCPSSPSGQVIIEAFTANPTPPVVASVIQPTCTISTGSVVLAGLPSAGTWTLIRYPGGITLQGTGTSITLTGLGHGTYYFTVTNASGCTSGASADIAINSQPVTPGRPVPGPVTNPTCQVPSGSVVINGLPGTGTWILTRFPGSITTTGTGTSTTVSGLGQGTYNFTVTNQQGCVSLVSPDVVIGLAPGPAPTLAITNPSPVCSPSTADLTDSEITMGSTPGLTFSYWTNAGATLPYNTPSQATAGTYYIKGTTVAGCFDIKPVVVTVLQKPLAYAGPDQFLDYLFSTTLQADLPGNNSTGTWSVITGSGHFADPDYAKTTVSTLAQGENILSWSVTNGVCQPSIDYVSLVVNDLLIPTLITPDMNGKNDYFVINGLETFGKTSLTVCDRRGAVVYETRDYDNNWYGLDYNGNPLPDDTYFFLLKPETGRSMKGYLVIRR